MSVLHPERETRWKVSISCVSSEPVAVSAKESFPPVWRVLGSGHTDGHWFNWVTDIICGVIFSLTVSHSIRDFRNSYVSSVCVSFYYYWKLTEHSLSIWRTHSTIYIDELWILAKEMRWGLDDSMDIPALISFYLNVPLWCKIFLISSCITLTPEAGTLRNIDEV